MNHMPACLQNQAPAILWALWNNLLRYAILYALLPLDMAMERGCAGVHNNVSSLHHDWRDCQSHQ